MILTFLVPWMLLSVQPHPTVKQRCSWGVTASLKLFLLVKFPDLSDIQSVWRFPCVAERMSKFGFFLHWWSSFESIFQSSLLMLVHFIFISLLMFSKIYLEQENESITSPRQLGNSFGFCSSRWLIIYMMWIRLTVSHFTAVCCWLVYSWVKWVVTQILLIQRGGI